uniref:Uncharacterized protein n=1 Tax=Amphimedon queenslandica TaxID=400682 RepID=A0A1X7TLG3_AMPQE
LLSYQQKKFK